VNKPHAIEGEAILLRIFIGESDRHGHLALYEAIVLRAHERGLAGATVLRGPMGFGANSQIHSAKILQLSTDLPIVIEIVDTEEKITSFLDDLSELLQGGMATLEKVRVIHYKPAGA
jgi:PII-like signaling protein